ncbi:MAG: DegT/DnrJ/EryC1/StrS family aminotransferase [Acidobacteria bacterium]|nr:DegT/DnrJ/EryC1/StrS family aminotransferase [Acidobacteriota bacterium]
MNVPLLDLRAQYQTIKEELDAAVASVIESQYFILGPKTQACEQAIADYSNCAHAVGVSSGTDALLIALMAEGIGPGDEIVTTAYSFFATAGTIARLGATPVFVDIDPTTYNIDPALIADRITDRTRAIMPVHLYGQMAEMEPIMELAAAKNLVVIEDAAQAIGSEHRGLRAGSIGHYGCFSFFPTKNLGGFGEGGMVVTNDPDRAEKLFVLRVHGGKPKYHHKIIGGNFKLDALQAAVVHAKLRHLDGWTAARQSNAGRYDRLFIEAGLAANASADSAALAQPAPLAQITTPRAVTDRHIFNQYIIRVTKRDELKAFLAERGVSSEIYYPIALHLQECFAYLGHARGDFPESERAASETLALPIYPELSEEQAQKVVDEIAAFFRADR